MKWMMITAVAATSAFLFYLNRSPIQQPEPSSVNESSNELELVPAQKPKKRSIAEKRQIVKKKVRNKSVHNRASAQSHSKAVISKATPDLEQHDGNAMRRSASKSSDRWIDHLSGEKPQIHLRAKDESKQDCVTKQCKLDEVYSLVGMVVETRRLNQKKYDLIDGGIGVGDTQKLPLLYVK